MVDHDELGEEIVDVALEIADRKGWSGVTLSDIANQMGIPLSAVYTCFPDLDDVANAWIKRADLAMLNHGADTVKSKLQPVKRIENSIMAWLRALQGRRTVMRDILFYKLKPPHFHLQFQFVVATSQRIQMLREATQLNATGLVKSGEEISLTLLFSSTVLVWLFDNDKNSRCTRDYLEKQLLLADKIRSNCK